jgi:heme oxygenase (biliverdin-IX-beta and delta-forming)
MATVMMPLLASLKETTTPYHKRLEKKLDLFRPGFSRTDYLLLLERFWGYYQPLKAKFANTPELLSWLPDLHRRAKLSLLETDLRVFGLDSNGLKQIPVCDELLAFNELAATLG